MADKTLKTDGSEPARQNNAAALLPQLYQAAQLPASTMGAIGSAQDANTQAALTGQNDLFNRQNNADTDLLAELSGIFGGVAPIGGTNTVQTTPATPWWQVQRAWWGRSSRTDSRKGLKKQRFPRSREWLVNSGDAERIE